MERGTKQIPTCPVCPRLQARIRELEAQLEEALRASKRQAAPFSKGEPTRHPKRPGRKPGGAYGQRASRPKPHAFDETLEVPFPAKCSCGGEVQEERVDEQFQTDIPQVRPRVTRFRLHIGCCVRCGRRWQGRHPRQTSDALGTAANQIGPNALVLATHMNKVLGVPYGKIAHFFAVAFGLQVGRATLVRAVVRIGHRAECLYRQIILIVRQSGVVYSDETGWRIAGQKAWLWALVTPMATVYRIARSRGFDVPAEIIGADYEGLLGRDGWAPYDHFLRALHQQCLQHFDRRAKNLEEIATGGAVRFPRAVQALVAAAFAVRDRRDEGAYTQGGLMIAIGHLKGQLQEILQRRLTHVQNRKLQKHLAKYQDQLFTFLGHPQIEGTNWPGEHAMRPAVLLRKISAGNRSDPGAHAHEVLLSVFRTACQRGVDPLRLLRRLLLRQHDDPLPSFLSPTG